MNGTPTPPPNPPPTDQTTGAYMRVAERVLEPGSTLLLHEFFEVWEKVKGRKPECLTYQAMEFQATADGIMVKGMCYANALVVLGYKRLADGQHTYDVQGASSDADIMLRGERPELVRVTNCVSWFSMALITNGKPKVVHPQDVKERRIAVAGKAQHYGTHLRVAGA